MRQLSKNTGRSVKSNTRNDSPLTCPSCRALDRVQKVSALYSAGLTSVDIESKGKNSSLTLELPSDRLDWTSGRSRTRSRGTFATHLATVLAPPQRPSLSVFFARLALLAIVLLVAALVYLTSSSSADEGASDYRSPAELWRTLGAVAVGLLLVAIPLVVGRVRKYRKWERPQWESAVRNWYATCYCHRCDVVYFEDATEAVPVAECSNLVWYGTEY